MIRRSRSWPILAAAVVAVLSAFTVMRLRFATDDFVSIGRRGNALERAHEYRAAIEQYRLAQHHLDTVYPDLRPKAEAAMLDRIAVCYIYLHQPDNARRALENSMKICPTPLAKAELTDLGRPNGSWSSGEPVPRQ